MPSATSRCRWWVSAPISSAPARATRATSTRDRARGDRRRRDVLRHRRRVRAQLLRLERPERVGAFGGVPRPSARDAAGRRRDRDQVRRAAVRRSRTRRCERTMGAAGDRREPAPARYRPCRLVPVAHPRPDGSDRGDPRRARHARPGGEGAGDRLLQPVGGGARSREPSPRPTPACVRSRASRVR